MSARSIIAKLKKNPAEVIASALLLLLFFLLSAGFGYPVSELVSDAQTLSASVKGLLDEQNLEEYFVTSVVDGDTLKVLDGSETLTIRLLGIDTPELNGEDGKECFAEEAKEFLTTLTRNKQVRLAADSTQADKDRYGRSLRYVFLDNQNINFEMISKGFAYEYTYNVPYYYQAEFKQAEQTARLKEIGLWGEQCS